MQELAARFDEGVHFGADAFDLVCANLNEVRVIRRQSLLERPRQCAGSIGREVSRLHEVLLEQRDDARVTRGIRATSSQQRSSGMEGGVVVTVHRAAMSIPIGEKVPFRAGSRGALHSVVGENAGFRRHSATPSRVTV